MVYFGNWSINRQWGLKELQASGVACVWPLFDSDWCPSAPHHCAPFTCSFTYPAPMFPSFLLFSMSASSTQHRCLSWHAAPYPLAFVSSRCQTLTACAVSVNIYPASFSSPAFADVCMCGCLSVWRCLLAPSPLTRVHWYPILAQPFRDSTLDDDILCTWRSTQRQEVEGEVIATRCPLTSIHKSKTGRCGAYKCTRT